VHRSSRILNASTIARIGRLCRGLIQFILPRVKPCPIPRLRIAQLPRCAVAARRRIRRAIAMAPTPSPSARNAAAARPRTLRASATVPTRGSAPTRSRERLASGRGNLRHVDLGGPFLDRSRIAARRILQARATTRTLQRYAALQAARTRDAAFGTYEPRRLCGAHTSDPARRSSTIAIWAPAQARRSLSERTTDAPVECRQASPNCRMGFTRLTPVL